MNLYLTAEGERFAADYIIPLMELESNVFLLMSPEEDVYKRQAIDARPDFEFFVFLGGKKFEMCIRDRPTSAAASISTSLPLSPKATTRPAPSISFRRSTARLLLAWLLNTSKKYTSS